MASYSQQYRFDITANTQQAQTQLDKLQKSLQAITTKKLSVVIDDSQLNEAAAAAQLLQQKLTAATDVKTGQLNLTAFNNSLQQAGTNVGQLSAQLLSAGTEGRQAFLNLSNAIANTSAPVKELSKGLATIGTTLINTIKWQAASSLIHGMMSNFSHAIGYAKELNSTLNDIRIVTGASSEEMAQFASQANAAAKQLSTTTGEFAKASLIYYQQGDSAAEAAQKAAITTKAANIAFTASAQEMSQMLTAVWNSYKMGGDELEHAVDVMAKLGATTATSMEEISTGMQKVAATANVVGVSMEQMSAMIATSSSVTRQSAEIVGTSWNTILSRFTSLKLGETLEDGVDLTKYTKALESIGVQALDVSGNLRNAGNIIDEIGQKWQMMNEAQKSAFAQTVGGVRQYTQIMAFFENFDKYQANLKTAQDSNGELNKQQEIYAESWEAASKRVKAAMEGLYDQLIDDKAITKLTSIFAQIINGVTALTQSFGGAGNVIGLLATQLIESNIDKFSTKLVEIGTNIKNLFSDGGMAKYQESLQDVKTKMTELVELNGLSEASKTTLRYDMQILQMKEKLAAAQDKLTVQQKASAEAVIQYMQNTKQFYTQLVQQAEAQEQKMKNVTEAAKQAVTEMMQQDKGKFLTEGQALADYPIDTLITKLKGNTEDVNKSLNAIGESFGILKPKADQTMGSILDTVVAVNRSLGDVNRAIEEAKNKFGDDWNVRKVGNEDTTELEQAEIAASYIDKQIKMLETSTNESAQNMGAALRDTFSRIDTTNLDELQSLLDVVRQSFEEFGGECNKANNELDKFGKATDIQQTIENLRTTAQKFGFDLVRIADSSDEASKKIQEAFEKATAKANATVQTFTNIAMAASRVTMALTSITNAWNTLQDPNVSGLQKVSTIFSTLVTIGFAMSSVLKLTKVGFLQNVAAAIVAKDAHLLFASAEEIAALNATKLKIAMFAEIAIIAAIVGALAYLIIKLANVETAEEKWAKKQEELNNSIEKTKQKHEELGSSLGELSSIMNDTTLTYEDQLTKINEIVSAYGLQADAVDVLTGKYGGLLLQVQEVAQAQAKANFKDAVKEVEEAQNLIEEAYNNRQKSREMIGTYGDITYGEDPFWAKLQNSYQKNDAASLFNSNAWINNGWTQDSNIEGILQLGQKTFENYFTDEARAWIEGSFQEQLGKIGFSFDINKGLSIAENYTGIESEKALYDLLTTYDKFIGLSTNSYTNKVIQALSSQGYGTLTNATQLQIDTQLVDRLFNEQNFDIARIDKGKASVQEIQQIIEKIDKTISGRTTLADYIGQFDQYKEAATQLKGIQQLSQDVYNIWEKDQDFNGRTKDQITGQIEKDLINQGIPVDVVLKLNATDIKYENDQFIIDEAAVHYAQAIVAAEEAAAKLANLRDSKISKAGQNNNIDADDYIQLQEANIFESDSDLQAFVLKNAGERKALWAQMIEETTSKQVDAIQIEYNAAKERLENLTNDFNDYYTAETKEQIDEWRERKGEVSKIIGELNAEMANYNQDQDQENYTYTYKEGDQEITKKGKEAYNYINNELRVYIEEQEQLDKDLAKYNMYQSEILTAQQKIVDSQKQLDALNYWETTGSKIETATNNAEKFAAAIGQKGKMSEDDLAWLNIMGDPNNVLEKYAQSSEEWNRYAYNQAKKYYAELYELREGDVIAQQAIKQKMTDLDTTYYKTLEDKAEAAARVIQDKWDKQIKAQDNVLNLISSNLTKLDELDFKNMDALRNNLKDAKVDAEQIERIIKNISEADTDEERIKAGMVAATEAALAKLSTLGQQKQDYIGIVTTLDTSKVDNTPIPVQADLSTEEAEDKLDNLNSKEFNPKGTAILDSQQVDDTIEGWKEAIANNSYVIDTVEGEPVAKAIKNWKADITNQTYTITLDSGETITSTITGWQTILADDKSNILKFTVQNGDGETQTVEKQIKDWIPDDEIVQIKVADGMGESTIESTITSWIVGTDESGQRYVQVGLDNGSTLQTDITDITTQDRDIVVELSDGTKKSLPADIGALVNPETGFKTKLTADGDLQKQIDEFKLHANVAVSFDMSNLEYDNAFASMDDYITKAFGNVNHMQIAQQLEGDINEALSAIKLDWTGNWDAQQAGFMTALINTVRTMPKDEISKLSKDYVGQIVAKLAEAMQSKSKATRQLAEFLWAGLKKGLQDSYTKENWQEALQSVGLDEDIYSAFAKILQIESPSKLTEGLAYWLFAGLSKGLKDGDKNFIIDPLTNVRDQLEEKAKEAIEGAGISKIIAEEYEKAIAAAKELNQLSGYIDLGLDKEIAQSLANANGDFYTAAENAGQAAVDQEVARQKQLNLIRDEMRQSGMTEDEIEQKIPTYVDYTQIYNNAVQAYIDNLFKQLDKGTGEQFSKEYISGKKWNDDSSMSDTKKAILNGAFNAAMKELNFTNEDLADSEKLDELVKLVQKNLNEDLDKLEVNIEEVWNEVQSIWANGLEALYKNETEIAEKTLKLWKDTFNAIKDARAGLAEGKSILETMYNDPEGMGKIIQSWVKQGFDFNEIQNMLRDSDLKIPLNFEAWNAEAYDKSGKQRFLEKDESGNYLPTTEKQFRENVNEYVIKELGQKLKDVINDTTKLDKLKTSTDKNDQALVEMLKKAGFMNQNGDLDLSNAKVEEVYEAVVNGIIDGMNQSDIDSLLGEAYTAQIAAKANLAYTARGEAENQVDIWQDAKDKIDTAIQTLLDKNSLDSMTAADKDSLVTVLKDMGFLEEGADASALSLETLQNASNTLAERMVTLAEQIGRAMQMIFNGEADSWQINQEGNVSVFSNKSWADAEATQWANIAMSNVELDRLKADMIKQAEEQALKEIEQQGFTELQLTGVTRNSKAAQAAYEQAYEQAYEEIKRNTNVRIETKLGNSSVSSKERGEKLNAAGNAVTDQDTLRMKQYAQACGSTEEEFAKMLKQLTKLTHGTKEFAELTEKEKVQLLNVVSASKKAETAWINLATKQKDAIAVIKKGDATSLEYLESLNSVVADVKAIFGDSTAVTEKFVAKHIADIEKMAAGDKAAMRTIQKAVLEAQAELDNWDYNLEVRVDVNKDGVTDELDTLGDMLVDWAEQCSNIPIGVEITGDANPAIAELNRLYGIGALTAEQITKILNDIGWEPKLGEKTISVADAQAMGVTGYVTYTTPEGKVIQGTIDGAAETNADATITIPTIESAQRKGTSSYSKPPSARPRATRTRAPRATRQPRERERRTERPDEDDAASRKSEAKKDEDIERYHMVNKQLEQQSRMLERVNKLKNAKYGGEYLKALRQENEELRRQAKIEQEKYEQAQKYLAADRERLQNITSQTVTWWSKDEQQERGATLAGLGFSNIQAFFDEQGNLDYQGYMEQINKEYNAMRERFMEDPEVWGAAWEAVQEEYDRISTYISRYEESLANMEQFVNNILDIINQLSSNNAEIIKYKVELEIEEINFDKSWMDYLIKAWDGEITHVADSLGATLGKIFGSKQIQWQKKGGFNIQNSGPFGGVLGSIDQYTKELTTAKDQYDVYTKYKDKIEQFASSGMNTKEIMELIGKDFINEADYIKISKSVRDALLTELNNLEEYKKALQESYENLLSLAASEWSKYESIVSHNISLIDTFKEIAKLTGEAYANDTAYRTWSQSMNEKQLDNYDTMIKQSSASYEAHLAQLNKLTNNGKKGLDELSEEERKQYDATLAAMQDAETKKYDYVKKKLELLKAIYEESIDDILKKLEKAMLDGTGSVSFADLSSDYEWYNEQQDRYLSSSKELYEVSKMNRTITEKLGDVTNQVTRTRLKELQGVIDKQAKLNKLTEYDINQMNLQYELIMALDELENARNNKSTVRLTRDEYGNMGYQYTANEDQINSAQQKYEDVLQKINETAETRVRELQKSYIDTMNDYYTQAKQIALEYADNEELKQQKLQELADRTKDRLQFLAGQLKIANANFAENNAAVFEHYGQAVQDYVWDGEKAINPTITALTENWQEHAKLVGESVTNIMDAFDSYQKSIKETVDLAQVSMKDMGETVETTGDQNEYAAQQMKQVTNALSKQYDQLNDATKAWLDYSDAIEEYKNTAIDMINKINKELEKVDTDDKSLLKALLGGYNGTGSGNNDSGSGNNDSGSGNNPGVTVGTTDNVEYSVKDLSDDEHENKVPVMSKYKDGTVKKEVSPGSIYTFTRMKGSSVYSPALDGWINIKYLASEQPPSTPYSTHGQMLADAIEDYRITKGYATGGLVDFTGPGWLDGTPSAPEYVLNNQQTDRMFDIVEMASKLDAGLIGDLFNTLDSLTTSFFFNANGALSTPNFQSFDRSDSHNTEQHIEIYAEFPDVSDYNEIKQAFDNIVNAASQYSYQ